MIETTPFDSSHSNGETEKIISKSAIVVVLWRYVNDWPIEFISSNVKHVLGYSHEDFISGKISYRDIIHPDDFQRVIDETESNIEKGNHFFSPKPYRVINNKGDYIWVKDITHVRKDENNIVTHLEGTIHEITLQIETEKQLSAETAKSQDRERRYKVFANASFEALFISEKGYCVEQNEAAVQLFGYSHEEAIGMFATDIFAEDSRGIVKENMTKGLLKPYDVLALRKDGTTFHAEVQGSTIELDGVMVRVTAIRDISERKYHEENILMQRKELRESNDLLQAKTKFLQAINSFSSNLEKIRSVEGVVWEIVENVIDNFHFEHCEIFLLDEDKERLTQVAKYRIGEEKVRVVTKPLSLKLGEGIVGAAVSTQKSIMVSDTSKDKRYIVDEEWCLSELTIPIIVDGEVMGVIDSEHLVANYFTQDHKDVLTTMANIAGARIQSILSANAVRESELKHRLIFEKAYDSIFLIQGDQFVDCNNVTLKMFGCNHRDEILGSSPTKFSPLLQADGQKSNIKAAQKINDAFSGKPQTFEWLHQKLDGTLFDAEVSLNGFTLKGEKYIQAVVRDITKRKIMEKALKDRKALYQNLIETTSAVPWEIKIDNSEFTYIGPQISELTGYEPELWTDLEFWKSTIHPEDREAAAKYCSQKTELGENHSIEYRIIKANKEIAWIHKGTTIIFDKGKPCSLRGYFLDITKQKKVEQLKAEYTQNLQDKIDELELVKENYRVLFERNPVSLWDEDFTKVLDVLNAKKKEVPNMSKYINENPDFVLECISNMVVLNVNEVSLSLFGVETKEELLSHLEESFNENSFEVFKSELIAISEGQKRFTSETEFTKKDGSKICAILNLEIIDSGKGVVSIVDVSALKQAEKELILAKDKAEKNEMYFRTIFETNIDAITISRLSDGVFTEVSPGFSNYVGYDKSEILGKTAIDLNLWENMEARDHVLSTVAKKGLILDYEMNLRTKSGKLRTQLLSIRMFEQNGEMHLLTVSHDITERKKSQVELTNKNIELLKAKDKAEESDRLKSEFLNNLSHEIRTPLNGIIGFSNFLSDSDLTDELRNQYVSIIQNSGNQLIRIIDEILEISRLETNQVQLHLTKVCLNDLLFELYSIFELLANERGLTLSLTKGLSNVESTILADETKLNKIISNLLQNAIKFTSKGFVEFGYVVLNGQIEIYVEDTGIGIKGENKKRIFERFAQEDKSIAGEYGGLGLGLSIVKEHVDLLGGKIKLESEKGKGTKFQVSIPYNPVKIFEKETPQTDESPSQLNKDECSVLVVEDDEVSALYLVTLLKRSGLVCDVIHAKNGQEAIDYCASENSIELVLMDISLPIVDGHEATRQIKKLRPNLTVVAQTAYSSTEDLKKIRKTGFDDITSKPINKESIIRILYKYLKKRI